MKTTFDPAITGGSNERGVDHSSHLFTFSSEATPSPQLVSLLFHSEKEEGKRGRGACKKKKGAKTCPALFLHVNTCKKKKGAKNCPAQYFNIG